MPKPREKSRLERLMEDIEHAIRSQDAGIQSELVRESAEVLVKTWSSLPAERREGFDSLLSLLVRQVNTPAKREFAERLAVLRRGPLRTLRLLACDPAPEVSLPLLEGCRTFDGETLVEIAAAADTAHREALARRTDLTMPLVDALVEGACRSVALTLLTNPVARFSDRSFTCLVALATSSETVAVWLAARDDLPAIHRPQLVRLARGRADSALADEFDDETAAETFLKHLSSALARPVTEDRLARFAASAELVATEAKPATPQQIERWIALRRIEDVLAAIAYQADLPVGIVVGAYDAPETPCLAAILRGLDFPWSTLKALLHSRHGRDLPLEALSGGYGTYRTVSPVAARRAVRWAVTGLKQGAFRHRDDDCVDAATVAAVA